MLDSNNLYLEISLTLFCLRQEMGKRHLIVINIYLEDCMDNFLEK